MRKSPFGFFITLLLAAALGFLVLYLFQSLWLKLVLQKINSNPSAGLPISSTQISGLSFPTKGAPASFNKELTVGNLGITVTGIFSPADKIVKNANKFDVLEKNEEYLIVYIKTRCISKTEKCRVTEFDFGVHSDSDRDYTAELSGNFSDDFKGLLRAARYRPDKTWVAR